MYCTAHAHAKYNTAIVIHLQKFVQYFYYDYFEMTERHAIGLYHPIIFGV